MQYDEVVEEEEEEEEGEDGQEGGEGGEWDEEDFDEQEAADFLRSAEEGKLDGVQIVREKPELLEVQDEVCFFLPGCMLFPASVRGD